MYWWYNPHMDTVLTHLSRWITIYHVQTTLQIAWSSVNILSMLKAMRAYKLIHYNHFQWTYQDDPSWKVAKLFPHVPDLLHILRACFQDSSLEMFYLYYDYFLHCQLKDNINQFFRCLLAQGQTANKLKILFEYAYINVETLCCGVQMWKAESKKNPEIKSSFVWSIIFNIPHQKTHIRIYLWTWVSPVPVIIEEREQRTCQSWQFSSTYIVSY